MPDQLLEMFLRLLRELLAWLPNAPHEQSARSRWGLEIVGGLVGAGLGGLITGGVLLNFTERMQRRLLVPQEEMQQRLLVQHEEMEQRLFTRQSTLQAYGEVLQPLLQNLPGHLLPSTADGGYVAAAGQREQIVRPHWDEARRLLTSPLCVYLPKAVLDAVQVWVSAETEVQLDWQSFDLGTSTDRILVRVAMNISADETSAADVAKLPQETFDEMARSLGQPDGAGRRAREAAQDPSHPSLIEALRVAVAYRDKRQHANRARTEAEQVLRDTLAVGVV